MVNDNKITLKRDIGLWSGVSVIGGIMIGSGVFYLGAYVLMRSNMSFGVSLLAWLIGGLVSLLGGLCYAELGVSMPRAGGLPIYLAKAYHPIIGFLSGFTSFIIGGPASIAAMAVALTKVLQPYAGLSDLTVKLVAAVIILLLTIYNIFGITMGKNLQNISMIAKLLPIVIIIGGGLFLGRQPVDLSIAPAITGMDIGQVISLIGLAVVVTLWAYSGWANLNAMTEEMTSPGRDLPRAIIVGIGGVTLVYALFYFAIYRLVPAQEIAVQIGEGNIYIGTFAASALFNSWGGLFISIGMVLAIFGGLNGVIITRARVYYGMAQDGHFFKAFGKLHRTYQVPVTSLLVQMVLAIGFVFLRNLDQLTMLVVFSSMIFGLLAIIAVPVMRYRFPSLPRAYKVPFYAITISLAIVVNVALIVNSYLEDNSHALANAAVIGIGIVAYFAIDYLRRRDITVE